MHVPTSLYLHVHVHVHLSLVMEVVSFSPLIEVKTYMCMYVYCNWFTYTVISLFAVQ